MDKRFPPLTPQSRLDARATARSRAQALALPAAPSLPWGEWAVAAVALLLLIAT